MLVIAAVLAWAKGHWRAVVVVLVVLAGLLLALCHPKSNPIPPKEQTSIDSMKATKPGFDSMQRVVKQQAARVVTRIVHDSAAAVTARAEADRYRRIADSALAVARAQHDTTSAAFVAADNATKEADKLRASNDTLSARLSEAHATILALTAQVTADSVRQNASDDLNARLANDLRHASPPCYLVPHLVGCPSRKTVAVVSLATGYLVSRKDVRDAAGRAVKGAVTLISP